MSDPHNLFGCQPPADTQEGWPLSIICRVNYEPDYTENCHGPTAIISPGGFYLERDDNPPEWVRLALVSTKPADPMPDDGNGLATAKGIEAHLQRLL